MDEDHANELTAALWQHLESLRRAGVTDLPRRTLPSGTGEPRPTVAPGTVARGTTTFVGHAPPRDPSAVSPAPRPVAPSPSPSPPPAPSPPRLPASDPAPAATLRLAPLAGPVLSREEKIAALTELRQQVAGCVLCQELASRRTQIVFGVGDVMARLCFVGEAPGEDEDRQGEPFVGAAGQLLNKIMAASGLTREEVYICNILRCRPPANRTPEPAEMAHCEPFLRRQLEIVRPEFICCLGSVAARGILAANVSVGRLRGKLHDYRGIPVAVTYHPAYLLRTPSAKRDVWEDMQFLMRAMGRSIPDR